MQTNRRNLIVRFLGGAALIYGGLMLIWPVLEGAFTTACEHTGRSIFGEFGKDGVCRFSQQYLDDELMLRVDMANRNYRREDGLAPAMESYFLPHLTVYLPVVMLLALVLATPLPWKRRVFALVSGSILTTMFVACRVGTQILWRFQNSTDERIHLYDLGPVPNAVLDGLYTLFENPFGPSLLAVVLIWLLVSFRREDMRKFLS